MSSSVPFPKLLAFYLIVKHALSVHYFWDPVQGNASKYNKHPQPQGVENLVKEARQVKQQEFKKSLFWLVFKANLWYSAQSKLTLSLQNLTPPAGLGSVSKGKEYKNDNSTYHLLNQDHSHHLVTMMPVTDTAQLREVHPPSWWQNHPKFGSILIFHNFSPPFSTGLLLRKNSFDREIISILGEWKII